MSVEKRHFHPVPDVWSLKSEKIKYREDLELSEYVRSFLLAFVEAELLAVEVRVSKAFIFITKKEKLLKRIHPWLYFSIY